MLPLSSALTRQGPPGQQGGGHSAASQVKELRLLFWAAGTRNLAFPRKLRQSGITMAALCHLLPGLLIRNHQGAGFSLL